jgi:hypothetical protein
MQTSLTLHDPEERPERESRLLSILLGVPPAYLAEALKKPLTVSKDFEEVLRTLFGEGQAPLPIKVSTKGKGQTLIELRQAIAYRLGVMGSPITPREALLYASLGDPGLEEVIRNYVLGQREGLLEGKVARLLGLNARYPYERYLRLLGRYLPVPLLELGAWQAAKERFLSEVPLDASVREAALQAVSLEDFKRKLSEASASRTVRSRWISRFKSSVPL